jgi:hypothetical protein
MSTLRLHSGSSLKVEGVGLYTERTVDESVWTAKDCAAYLKVSSKHFLRDYRFRDGFPRQLAWSIEGRPRWSAQAVKDWALRPDYATAA